MDADELDELMNDAVRLTRELDQVEATLDEAIAAASAAGASQHDIAAATGLSRSAVQRRLAVNGVSAPETRPSVEIGDEDEELVAWRNALRAEQLKTARLRTAREARRLQLQQDAAAQLEEANALTRVGPLDFDI